MKRKLLYAVAVALLLAVPAIPQGDDADSLRQKVIKLEKQVVELVEFQKSVEQTLKAQEARNAALAKQLVVAEKKGYLYPGANVDAKKAILKGLRALVGAPTPKVEESDEDSGTDDK